MQPIPQPYEILEQQLGRWLRNPNVVACSSGTAALHLAIECLDLNANSRVIVPEFTMVACARAVSLASLRPTFLDCDNRLLLDCNRLETAPRGTTAIMPVHVYGRRCDMTRISQFAAKRNLRVIEDMAEAHGIPPHPDSDAACYSFYRNKIIAGEEGGAIAFKDPKHALLARKLRSLGFTDSHDFHHLPRGHNYRLANLLAHPILLSLREVGPNLQRRHQMAALYDELLPPEWHMPPRDVCWVYDLRIPGIRTAQQDQIIQQTKQYGARHGFKPMSAQREYRSPYHHLNAWRLAQEVLYFPLDPQFSDEWVRQSAATLVRVVSAVQASTSASLPLG